MAIAVLFLTAFLTACAATTRATPPTPVAAASAAATPATSSLPDAEFLLQLDREFSRASNARGADAWQEIMAPNAAKPADGGRWLMGPEEIGNSMREAFKAGFQLTWEPTRAEMSRGGKLGYTWGRYRSMFNGKAREGTYMTVWQKQATGVWKILFDTGDAD